MLHNLKNDLQNGFEILRVRLFFWLHRTHFAPDGAHTPFSLQFASKIAICVCFTNYKKLYQTNLNPSRIFPIFAKKRPA